jgi:subtilisin family serine protease
VVSAIYGAKAAGIKCINLSLGMDTPDAAMKKALRDFCSDGVSIATIAAGNDGKKTDYPAGYCSDIPGVISVAATEIRPDGHIRITSFSSWGAITIAAPGHGLKSRNHLDELEFVSGTSFAAPFVGGTIAVMQALRPGITQGEIMAVLHATSKPMAEGAPKAGFGEIDILAIIQRTLDKTPIQPLALPGVKRKWWHKLLG